MNRYQIIYFLVASFWVATLVGCEDYLSALPDNRTTLDSRKKIAQLLVSAYPEAHHAFFTEAMSDNAGDKGSLPSQNVGTTDRDVNTLSYEWKYISYEANSNANDAPNSYWAACYTAIAAANHALEAIETIGEEELAPLRGEALLARAYAHFMLVNLWAKQYDSTTAEKDLGIPYVLAPEKVALKSWKRNTVKEVYDLIEKDIQKGIPLLKNEYDKPRFHFTIEAGHAFAARFYLYKGDWKNVIKHASRILTQDGANLRDWNGSAYIGSVNRLLVRYTSSAEPANLLIVSTSSIHARYFAFCRYQMTRKLKEYLLDTARSLLPTGTAWKYSIVSSGGDLTDRIPKFKEYFKLTNVSSGTGYPYASFVLLSYDEVLLNRAEAYAMTNRFDLARADMALFMSKKSNATATYTISEADLIAKYPSAGSHKPYYTLSPLQESYVKAIADLRRLEFLHEGMRWFDIRRFHLSVEHLFSDGRRVILTPDDPRRELGIPRVAVTFGLRDNPR